MELREILDGERKDANMDKETRDTAMQVADYENGGKQKLLKKIRLILWSAFVVYCAYIILDFSGIGQGGPLEFLSGFLQGLVFGAIVVGLIYTSKYMSRLRAFKLRLIKREEANK